MITFLGNFIFQSCTSNEKYKQDLLSDDTEKIHKACYALGEARDTSAVKILLSHILDPRLTTHINYDGMTVNFCKLGALRKISNIPSGREPNEFGVDTAASIFYLNWAIKNGFIKDSSDVDIYYSK